MSVAFIGFFVMNERKKIVMFTIFIKGRNGPNFFKNKETFSSGLQLLDPEAEPTDPTHNLICQMKYKTLKNIDVIPDLLNIRISLSPSFSLLR